MRKLTLTAAILLMSGGAALAQRSDRITASPTVAKGEANAVDAATSTNLIPGLAVFTADGQGVGRVASVVRGSGSQINSVVIEGPDGKHRSLMGSTVKVERGRAVTTLRQAEIMALPEVKG